jgi:hypothetical protein
VADEIALWSTDAWHDEATSWLDGALADAGMTRTGEITQPHLEPWSTVLTSTTDNGRVWLKAMVDGTAFEITLYDVLVRVTPEHVLHPIASDRERGWMLLPDGGPSLADRFKGDRLVEAMVAALPQYASVQIALADTSDTLFDLGLADLRPHLLADRYRQALARYEGTAIGGFLSRLEADYLGWCDAVSESPLPATLDHNDLHPWNILGVEPAPDRGTTPAIIYDWGDSVVADPLGSAAIPISRVRRMVGLDEASPEARRMRDAYLEPFTRMAPSSDLVELLDASSRLAKATRAVVWDGSVEEIELYLIDLHHGFGGL